MTTKLKAKARIRIILNPKLMHIEFHQIIYLTGSTIIKIQGWNKKATENREKMVITKMIICFEFIIMYVLYPDYYVRLENMEIIFRVFLF